MKVIPLESSSPAQNIEIVIPPLTLNEICHRLDAIMNPLIGVLLISLLVIFFLAIKSRIKKKPSFVRSGISLLSSAVLTFVSFILIYDLFNLNIIFISVLVPYLFLNYLAYKFFIRHSRDVFIITALSLISFILIFFFLIPALLENYYTGSSAA